MKRIMKRHETPQSAIATEAGERGFTLIETLVSVTLVALMAITIWSKRSTDC